MSSQLEEVEAETLKLTREERALEVLREHPNLGAPWRAVTRRFPLRRFPYSVLFVVEGTELRVMGLAHQRWRAGHWSAHK
jgi:hypothetical protein